MNAAPGASGRRRDNCSCSFLGQCLVESDRSEHKRDRRNKQRALVISIVVQILIVAALVIFPLFSKGENIASRVVIAPTVPYRHGSGARQHQKPEHQQQQQIKGHLCSFCPPDRIPHGIPKPDSGHHQQPTTDDNNGESDLSHVGDGGSQRGIDFVDSNRGPEKPDDQGQSMDQPGMVRRQVSEPLQQAMLIRRVEPVYPTLPLQIRREGRVQLHAIISTSGTIESLEVVAGDPMFIRSALDAVRQWRYRPTILNGQPVEVETYITVIYTLAH